MTQKRGLVSSGGLEYGRYDGWIAQHQRRECECEATTDDTALTRQITHAPNDGRT